MKASLVASTRLKLKALSLKLTSEIYASSHNHSSVQNGCVSNSSYIFYTFHTQLFSTSMIMGERVVLTFLVKKTWGPLIRADTRPPYLRGPAWMIFVSTEYTISWTCHTIPGSRVLTRKAGKVAYPKHNKLSLVILKNMDKSKKQNLLSNN